MLRRILTATTYTPWPMDIDTLGNLDALPVGA
jgi:hypothetical protein